MRLKYLFAVLLAVVLCSCTERIDFKLNSAPSRLVITGYVCTEPGQYAIHLSQTGGYLGGDSLTASIPHARVSINGTDLFQCDTVPYMYLTTNDFCAVEGETYNLKVVIDFDGDGVDETYTASAVAPMKVELQEMILQTTSNHTEVSQFPLTTIIIFQDPKGIDVNYGAHLSLTTARDSLDTYHKYHISNTPSKYCTNLFNADVVDGSLVFYPAYVIGKRNFLTPLDTLMVFPYDTVEVELNCHSKDYYEFIRQSQDAASGSSPMFMTPAGPVTGNISGGAIGAFGVYTISRKSAVVKYSEGSWTDEQMKKRFGYNWREKFPKK